MNAAGDPILEEVRRFYDDHHDGIEQARGGAPLLLRAPDAHPARARPARDSACWTSAAAPATCWRRCEPSHGVGIDLSERHVADAQARYGGRGLRFVARRRHRPAGAGAGRRPVRRHPARQRRHPPRRTCRPRSRRCTRSATGARASSSTATAALWQPVLRVGGDAGPQVPPAARVLAAAGGDREHARRLADFEVVRARRAAASCPSYVPLLSDLLNRYVGHLPLVEWLSLMYGIVARPAPHRSADRARRAHHQRDHPVPQRGRPHPLAGRRGCRTWARQRVPLRRGQLHGRHGGGASAGRSPRTRTGRFRFLKQPGRGQGRRGAARLRGGAGRRRAHPRLRHGRGARRTCRSSWTPWSAARARW